MARQLRIEFKNAIYHVISRGIEKSRIFFEEEDFKIFLSHLKEQSHRFKISIFCYCLMDNHFHLLLQTKHPNLSLFMKRFLGNYATYINNKYDRCGHLFQGRYKSFIVSNNEYFIRLSKYIHLNPCKANIVKDPKDFQWSSLWNYKNDFANDLVEKNKLLRLFKFEKRSYFKYLYSNKNDESKIMSEIKGGMVFGNDKDLKLIKDLVKSKKKDNVYKIKDLYILPIEKVNSWILKEHPQIQAYCLWEWCKLSQKDIAKKLCKSQTTISRYIYNVKAELKFDKDLSQKISRLEKHIAKSMHNE